MLVRMLFEQEEPSMLYENSTGMINMFADKPPHVINICAVVSFAEMFKCCCKSVSLIKIQITFYVANEY